MKDRIFRRLNDTYALPEEVKLEVSRKNLTVLIFFTTVLILLAAFMIIINLLLGGASVPTYKFVYYGGVICAGALSLIGCRILKKRGSYWVNQLFLIIILSLMFILLLYNFRTAKSFLSGIISVFTGALLYIICFEISPMFHASLMTVFIAVIMASREQLGLPLALTINGILFCGCIFFLALFRRKTTVLREKQRLLVEEQTRKLELNNTELDEQKNSLMLSKDYLEKYAQTQSEEILNQNERIIRIQNNTIVSLANLVENRDEDTGGHVLRTRDYVGLIAMKAYLDNMYPELDEKMIRLFVKAAPMHDIGKIVVPDAILKKPGRLTPEEFEQIKLHTTKGGEIVENVLGAAEDEAYVKVTKEIATMHHERFDGTGYPFGLSGTDIPLGARMMAIADVFDALVSQRCYKEPMTEDEAFEVIMESAGTHFDPDLARLFIDARDEVVEIALRR